MKTHLIAATIVFTSALSANSQEPPPNYEIANEMLSVALGKPYPHAAIFPNQGEANNPPGFYAFTAPNVTSSPLPFPEYLVAINSKSNAVYFVKGVKTFLRHRDCTATLKTVVSTLRTRFNIKQDKFEYSAIYEARAGDTYFRSACETAQGSPYVDLMFLMRSEDQYKTIGEWRLTSANTTVERDASRQSRSRPSP